METFAEYLSFYVNRAGISDAELARAIDVSRQTVFRWKEGTTNRPNNRDDVLAIAEKLRLSVEERNTLLLVAGFRPQNVPIEEDDSSQQSTHKETTSDTPAESTSKNLFEIDPSNLWRHLLNVPIKRKWIFAAICFEILLFALIGVLDNIDYSRSSHDKPSNTTPVIIGESLIVIAPFTNSDNDHFSHQLSDAIKREISGNRITGYRTAELSDAISEKDEASQILQNAGTELVIYGQFTEETIEVLFEPVIESANEDCLTLVSNKDLPTQTQSLALIALAQLSILKNDTNQAISILSQAQGILTDNVENEQLLAIVSSQLDQLLDGINQ